MTTAADTRESCVSLKSLVCQIKMNKNPNSALGSRIRYPSFFSPFHFQVFTVNAENDSLTSETGRPTLLLKGPHLS